MPSSAQAAKTPKPESVSAWVRRLSDSGMPVMAHTAGDIARVSQSEETGAAELARVVLQDAAMTARLLRVANSPVFNPVGKSISTVSRAVVVLGFQEVRSICLSIAIVESLLEGERREQVIEEMAHAFHAAVQARALAIRRKDKAPEEIFIATLLLRLGDMAFWTFGDASAECLAREMKANPDADRERLQRKVLGFPLRELTLGLGREWKLGQLLEDALDPDAKNPRAQQVQLGHRIAETTAHGWNQPRTRKLIEQLAGELKLSPEATRELIQENAREAARTAANYGADEAGRRIPQVEGEQQAPDGATDEHTPTPYPEPDPALQLTILRELSALMESRPNLNMVLEMVLEGMYRGIGMDRTLFALCTPDRGQVIGRYALGVGNDELCRRFRFPLGDGQASLFTRVISQCLSAWSGSPRDRHAGSPVDASIRRICGEGDFFTTPIEINGRAIGLFYADRQPSGRELDEESYASFRHFTQQANQALTLLSQR